MVFAHPATLDPYASTLIAATRWHLNGNYSKLKVFARNTSRIHVTSPIVTGAHVNIANMVVAP